ncbi:MAG: hypothetical protein UY04_C0003G0013 [Parcubacteria group bacterium GW2011_GWA2_47_7]|nr:MAG: hypothetical protein UY04_C0003G0013 [Parcubacteria group bacterium GW2011_GWA2_47_7]
MFSGKGSMKLGEFIEKSEVDMSDYRIVDSRKNTKGKSLQNSQRYIERQKDDRKKAIREKIAQDGIKDLGSDEKKRLRVKLRGTEEPHIGHSGGVSDRVYPGNKKYGAGDRLPRPDGGGGEGGRDASDHGEGDDDFYFELSTEEWQDAVFDGLEIPDMVKKFLAGVEEFELKHAGLTNDGPPNKMNIVKTMARSLPRRTAFRLPHMKRKQDLEDEIKQLEKELASGAVADPDAIAKRIDILKGEVKEVERKLASIPFLEKHDLRFNRHEMVPVPIAQAVMFCMMDVSGSMEEWHKEMAKRFFLLLYLFLRRNYERVAVVFLRHTTEAREVTEEEFFTDRDTGGTRVSSVLELMKEIVGKRFPLSEWNIYGCQASDGDDWRDDLPVVEECMTESILPISQYYAYVEVRQTTRASELWPTMNSLSQIHDNLAVALVTDQRDIYPVFRKLFEKQGE